MAQGNNRAAAKKLKTRQSVDARCPSARKAHSLRLSENEHPVPKDRLTNWGSTARETARCEEKAWSMEGREQRTALEGVKHEKDVNGCGNGGDECLALRGESCSTRTRRRGRGGRVGVGKYQDIAYAESHQVGKERSQAGERSARGEKRTGQKADGQVPGGTPAAGEHGLEGCVRYL